MIKDPNTILQLKQNIDPSSFIRDSRTAYFFSNLLNGAIKVSELRALLNHLFETDELDDLLSCFVESGVIEVKGKELDFIRKPPHLRDFSKISFNEHETAEVIEIANELKNELLFLYHYGPNTNLYKILNLKYSASETEIKETLENMIETISENRILQFKLGTMKKKIENIRHILKGTEILLDPEKRKKYDHLLIGIHAEGDNEKNHRNKAAHHYSSALLYSSQNNFTSALREIKIAVVFDPTNEEYNEFLATCLKLQKKERLNHLLNEFIRSDLAFSESNAIKDKIDIILEMGDHSGSLNLQLAEILFQKKYLNFAKKLAVTAKEKDNTLSQKAGELLELIEIMRNQK